MTSLVKVTPLLCLI